MFERYTEKARRVIFFARYEASQFGSPCIESEHLLLGLLREDKRLVLALRIEDPFKIRQRVEAHNPPRSSFPTSVDLPLSDDSKRILKEGAEEADRLHHDRIDTNHLLLAMLRQRCYAAELLRQCGVTPEAVQTIVMEPPRSFEATPLHERRTRLSNTIAIHSAEWDAEYIHDRVKSCAEIFWHWHQQPWKACDVAVHRSTGRITFDLTLAENSKDYEIVKAGWKKDHCAVCRWELFESEDASHGTGYTNGREWLCVECYEMFWGNPHFFTSNYPEIT